MEEKLTIFIGLDKVSIYKAKYEGDFPWKSILVTKYPMSFGDMIKALFNRSKYIDIPIMKNISPETKWFDLDEYLIFGDEDSKVRIIFMDLSMNENLSLWQYSQEMIMKILPDFIKQKITRNETTELKVRLLESNLLSIRGRINDLGIKDKGIKEALQQADNIQEIKKKTWNPYQGGNQ